MRIVIASVIASLLVAACTGSGSAQYTVSEYKADKALRRAQLERCADNPGTLKDTPDCINARQAEREDRTRLRDMPPLNLPRADAGALMVPVTTGRRGA